MNTGKMQVNNRSTGEGAPICVIAEIAGAHEGSMEKLTRLIDAAKTSSADAVKLQVYRADTLAVPSHPAYQLYRQLEYDEQQWERVMHYARSITLPVFADVFDDWGLHLMERYGAHGYKVHPTIVYEDELLALVAATKKPLLLGVGGVPPATIKKALKTIAEGGGQEITLIHGFQSYPTRPEDTNLLRIAALKETFGLPVGFADHVDADSHLALILPLVAVGCGAQLVEKHLTLDRSKKGPDYYSSLNPDEFSALVSSIRAVESVLGKRNVMSHAEEKYIDSIVRRIVAARSIESGDLISREKIAFKRVDGTGGLLPSQRFKVLHKKAKNNLNVDELITADKVESVRTGVFIAVRMKSTRLPKKAMIEIEGRTIIEHLIERVKAAKMADVIVVCTSTHPDDAVLVDVAKKAGVKWFAGSENNVMDRFLGAARQERVDMILRTTGDCPLTDPEHADKAIAQLAATGADYVRVVGMPLGAGCEVFTTKALAKAHSNAIDPAYSEYMSFYFWNNPDVFRIEELECDGTVRRPHYRLTVDVTEDLELMREIYGRLYHGGRVFPLTEVIALLDSNPDLAALNSQAKLRWRDDRELIDLLNKKTRLRPERSPD